MIDDSSEIVSYAGLVSLVEQSSNICALSPIKDEQGTTGDVSITFKGQNTLVTVVKCSFRFLL
jgi:hypothetical protein